MGLWSSETIKVENKFSNEYYLLTLTLGTGHSKLAMLNAMEETW